MIVFKMVRKETLLTSAMILLITYTLSLSFVTQAFPQNQATKTLSSSGSIQIQASPDLGIYSNSQGTTPLSSLSWGTLEPGQSQTYTIYVKNEGNVPLTLSLETDNWIPASAENYLTLNWNYNYQALSPDAIRQITLTLVVNPNITGITNFSFEVIIVGS